MMRTPPPLLATTATRRHRNQAGCRPERPSCPDWRSTTAAAAAAVADVAGADADTAVAKPFLDAHSREENKKMRGAEQDRISTFIINRALAKSTWQREFSDPVCFKTGNL